MRERRNHVPWPLKMGGALILVPGILFLISWFVFLLWNALMPELFGLRALTYWQAMGLMVLVKLLVSGPRPHGPRRPFRGRARFEDREAWKRHMRDRFGPGSDFRTPRGHGGYADGAEFGDPETRNPDS
jgi:Ca2+/H+ antiporter, TMEM165/GDT1 family